MGSRAQLRYTARSPCATGFTLEHAQTLMRP